MPARVGESRVLHVSGFDSVLGGGERHVRDLVSLQRREGLAVAVVCPPRGPLWDDAPALDVERFGIDLRTASPGHLLGLRSAIERFAPDIVHAHGGRAALWSRLADPSGADRVVYTVHGIHVPLSEPGARRHARFLAERVLRARTARFITVCSSDVEKGASLGVLDPQRTSVVHNGIDASAFTYGSRRATGEEAGDRPARENASAAPGPPTALFVGRLAEQKDPPALIEAWSVVHAALPEARLLVVGDGPLEATVRSAVEHAGLRGVVSIEGAKHDPSAYYRRADALLLPSRWEGFPYVVLEAMASGLPVVATAVDGVPEAISDGVSGRLVPPGEASAFGEAVLGVLTAKDRGRSLGQAGRRRVTEDFTLERMVRGVADVYESIGVASMGVAPPA